MATTLPKTELTYKSGASADAVLAHLASGATELVTIRKWSRSWEATIGKRVPVRVPERAVAVVDIVSVSKVAFKDILPCDQALLPNQTLPLTSRLTIMKDAYGAKFTMETKVAVIRLKIIGIAL
jgi:hypothetical protein